MEQQISNKISDNMTLGLFDTDGSVHFKVDLKKNQGFSVRTQYYFAQSRSKADTVHKFAEKFDGSAKPKSQDPQSDMIFNENQSSTVGQKVRTFLLDNKPLHPYRLKDFLIGEQVIKLQKENNHTTIEGKVILIYLIGNVSKNEGLSDEKKNIEKYLKHINASENQITAGQAKANDLLKQIEPEVEQLCVQLKDMKLTDEYVYGAHYGDGSFTVALNWKPIVNKKQRLRCEPEWCVSGADEHYCLAFKNTFGGNLNKVKRHFKFRFGGIQNTNTICIFLDRAPWIPVYKKEQLEIMKKAIKLLQEQRHLTIDGQIELIDLVYDFAEKGKRPYTKEQYLAWGKLFVKHLNQ